MSNGIIITYSGKLIDVFNPDISQISIFDIAMSLSRQERFNGHSRKRIDVAQHSVMVSKFCEDPKWGLMHDTAEGYLGDIVRPIKGFLPEYKKLEFSMEESIAGKYNLPLPIPSCVKETDSKMLLTEKKWFKPNAYNGEETYPIRLVSWSARYSYRAFIRRFCYLFGRKMLYK